MARYKLLTAHFLGDRHFLAGVIVDWDGPPSRHMEAVDEDARIAVATLEAKRRLQGRPPKRPVRSSHRATPARAVAMASALRSPSSLPGTGDRPLWSGFTPVPQDQQGRPAPPPKPPQG